MSSIIEFLSRSDAPVPHEKLKESYFTFNNPTVGTGIACNADPTAITATEACLIIDNSATRQGNNPDNHHVILDYIKMTVTAAGTGATKARLAFFIDNINRYSSGGTELTGKNTSYDTRDSYSDRTPKAKVYFGDITATAANSAKHLNACLIRNDTQAAPCFIEDDIFRMSHFCQESHQQDAASSPVVTVNKQIPYIVLGPGTSLVVAPLFEDQSAASSFEIEVGLVEAGHPTST
jgi:hypothetical protein